MRPILFLSGVFLCLNVLLLIALATSWRQPTAPGSLPLEADADLLGMDLYSTKAPFAVFVAKEFPQDGSFHFLHYGQPLSVSVEKVEGDETRREATLYLGENFSISCKYSPDDAGRVTEWLLMEDRDGLRDALFDYNADGFVDAWVVRDEERRASAHYVMYDGEWREVAETKGKCKKQLKGGQEVEFDMKSGQWAVTSE